VPSAGSRRRFVMVVDLDPTDAGDAAEAGPATGIGL
jgi:hypothetical protein